MVVQDQAAELERILSHAVDLLTDLVADFELIVVENGSSDQSIAELKRITGESGLPNLQVFALTKEVSADTASWVGIENALGDFVAVLDPRIDDIAFLPALLREAMAGVDVVFAANLGAPPQSLSYRLGFAVFNNLYKWFGGVDLASEAPHFRIVGRKVVAYIQQHVQPWAVYRHLPATGGFSRVNLTYQRDALPGRKGKRFDEGFQRAMRLLVSTTQAPMRLVTLRSFVLEL